VLPSLCILVGRADRRVAAEIVVWGGGGGGVGVG